MDLIKKKKNNLKQADVDQVGDTFIQPCSAFTAEGIDDAFNYVINLMDNDRQMTKEQIKRLKTKYPYAFNGDDRKTITKENTQNSRGCCDFTCCFAQKEEQDKESQGSWVSAVSSNEYV